MIEQTTDVQYIKSIATHPRVWPWISEDQDKPENYTPDIHRTVYLRFEGGYMSFKPFTRACWECHICALPGTKDVKAKAIACFGWMAARGVGKFLAKIPAPNWHAVRLARSIGFVGMQSIPGCVMRGGRLVDMVLMRYQHG